MAKRRSKSKSKRRSGSRRSGGKSSGGSDIGGKLLLALIMGLLFFILSQDTVYKGTDWVFGKLKIHTQNQTDSSGKIKGCPSVAGNAIHAVVYALLTFLLLEIL